MSDFKVHIIGCGSAAPDLFGNHGTSQCVEYKSHYYLFDCGEGTQYGLYKHRIGYNKIDAIFISHLHGDHFLGFIGVISALALTTKRDKPLDVYAPAGFEELMKPMLNAIFSYFTFDIVFHVLDKPNVEIFRNKYINVRTLPANHKLEHTYGFMITENEKDRCIIPEMIHKYNIPYHLIAGIKKGDDFINGEEVIANHVITTDPKKSYSYAYCADGYECPELLDAVKGAEIVYHETSFLETETENAMKYKHATPKIASEVARAAGAKRLIMGHMSARYFHEDLPKFMTEHSDIFSERVVANENMVIDVIDNQIL